MCFRTDPMKLKLTYSLLYVKFKKARSPLEILLKFKMKWSPIQQGPKFSLTTFRGLRRIAPGKEPEE